MGNGRNHQTCAKIWRIRVNKLRGRVAVSAVAGATFDVWLGAQFGRALGSWAGPIGFAGGVAVGVGVSAAWEYAVQPFITWVYTSSGRPDPFVDIRNLQQLGGN